MTEEVKKELKFKSLKELFVEYIDGINLEDDLKSNVLEKVNSLFDSVF